MAVSVLRFFCFEMLHVLHIPRFLRNIQHIQHLPVKKKNIFSQKVRSLKIWGHSIWWHCGTILCSINFPHFTGSQRLFWNRIPQIKDIFPHKKWVKVMFKTHQPENHWRNQHFQFGSLWLDWPRRFTGNRVTLLLLKTIGWSYILSIFQKSLEHQRLDDAKTL